MITTTQKQTEKGQHQDSQPCDEMIDTQFTFGASPILLVSELASELVFGLKF